ncbi:MAG: TIGR02302 family protein [Hyphomicrobiaceae bacterium]
MKARPDPWARRQPASAVDPVGARLAQRRFEQRVGYSRLALVLERVWPRLWLLLGLAGLFLLMTVLGVWQLLPALWQNIVQAGFGLAALASLVVVARVRWPSRDEAIHRLEVTSGIPHRPASAYEDTLTGGEAGSLAHKLFDAHRRRMGRLLESLRVKWPSPRVERHDPWALRALLVLLIGAGAVMAGDSLADRFRQALRLGPGTTGQPVRIDAWLSPPAYSGRQPILLADGSKPVTEDQHAARAFEVPEGSVLVIRAAGQGHDRIHVAVGDTPDTSIDLAAASATSASASIAEFRDVLTSTRTLRVKDGRNDLFTWQITVLDDRPPEIALTKPVGTSFRGAMQLAYKVTDDYGVLSADATVALSDKVKSMPLKLSDGTIIGAFGDAPVVSLKLPRSAKGSRTSVEGKTQAELQSHPWAGLKVELTLSAKDQAGQVGSTIPQIITMPARKFRDPLAAAVVEQRRKLALSPGSYQDVARALDALTIAPEQFIPDLTVYLGLRTAYRRLGNPPSVDSFQSVIDQLWEIALRIEDGDMSDAERALKDAQDRLSKALEEGASEEEIARLMQELREALNKYLQELVQQAGRQPPDAGQQAPQQFMSQQDLEEMLKKIEEMAKSGAKDAAQQMLSELRDMLDRLQAGKMAQGQGSGQQMMQMMEQFGGLITKQRRLMDDTFGAQRGNQSGSQSGEGQEGNQQGQLGQGGQGLEDRQSQLRQELGRLMDQLRGMGDAGNRALGDARNSMEGAEEALRNGDLDDATRRQAEALDNLRRGAQAMTEQMLSGRNGQSFSSRTGGDEERDPLNRPLSDEVGDGRSVKVPRDIDMQRARELLQELRRRLGEASRPEKELDYIERLLKQN